MSTRTPAFMPDHLGSTSITTNASGAMTSQMKYREASLWDKAWGEGAR